MVEECDYGRGCVRWCEGRCEGSGTSEANAVDQVSGCEEWEGIIIVCIKHRI